MIEKISGVVMILQEQNMQLLVPPLVLSITVPTSVTASIGSSIELYTHFYFNQENGYSVFGFSSLLEKTIFRELIECTGVGPRLAITILSTLSPESIFTAVCKEEVELLKTVPGIGQKKAEQLLLSLRHTLKKWEGLLATSAEKNPMHSVWSDVEQALAALEYSRPEIIRALRATQKEHEAKSVPFDQALRSTLNYLRQQKI